MEARPDQSASSPAASARADDDVQPCPDAALANVTTQRASVTGSAEDLKLYLCAACGKQSDAAALKRCNTCKLVRYCGVDCQRAHRKQHKKACNKRAAELRDETLFKQPEEHYHGDCPICFLPLPFDPMQFTFKSCCGKDICNGCKFAGERMGNNRLCCFCRTPNPTSKEEFIKRARKRMKAGDIRAYHEIGTHYYNGGAGLAQNWGEAIKLFTKAVELGSDVASHYQLGVMHWSGQHVNRDFQKALKHFTIAANGGHPIARYGLAAYEIDINGGNFVRAMKHYLIAAKMGHNESLNKIKEGYQTGIVSKDDYLSALRAHQCAGDERKSKQRDEAVRQKYLMGT